MIYSVIDMNVQYYTCQFRKEQQNETYLMNYKMKIIDDMMTNANKFVTPPNKKPFSVKMNYIIFGFSDISELNMDFTLSYYMRLTWMDSRLSFNPVNYVNITEVILHPEKVDQIWRPDLSFRNDRGRSLSEKLSIFDTYCRIYASGEIFLSRKLETTLRCHMMLHDYPFDIQICSLNIDSFSLGSEILEIGFFEIPVEFDKDVELTSFELLEIDVQAGEVTFSTGTFPSVTITFKFRRYLSFYILQVGKNLDNSSNFQV